MKYQFEQALDACLAQLNTGADLEVVLTDFPECADELRPALAASEWMQRLAPPPERKHVSKDLFVAVVADRRRLVERVDGLVVEVKVGVPVAELLARTAAPLQGVVCAAHAMHTDVAPMPAAETIASGKAAFMARVAQQRALARRPAATAKVGHADGTRRSIFGDLAALPMLARRAVSSAVVLSMTAVIGVSGVIQVSHAAASSLPGEALYQVKLIGQNARMLFLFDPAARSALQSEYGQRRLADIETLVATGRSVPAEAIEALLADSASLDGLTTAQRGMLSGLIGSLARTDAALAARLRAVVGDPVNVDAMRRGSPATIPNRKPVEVQLPADEFAPVPEPVVAPSVPVVVPVVVPAPPANGSEAALAAPPSSHPPVRGAVDVDDPDSRNGGENGGVSAPGVVGPADPGTIGGDEPQPDEPEPPVPPHTQPNAEPEPEARSLEP